MTLYQNMLVNQGIKFGEIWWTQCSPSVGNEFRDRHPTLIVQSDNVRRKGSTEVITVMIFSSYKGKRGPYDVLIPSTSGNGLLKPTLIKVEYIVSFDRARFLKKIGDLELEWIAQVKSYLRVHFGLEK